MEIIACRPKDDQFWIGCSKEEAQSIFLPKLSEKEKDTYFKILEINKSRPESYWEMVMKNTESNEIHYAYFNVSRDLIICFPEQPHFPFANMWDAYSPFRKIDHKTISSLNELRDLIMTYQGKEYGTEIDINQDKNREDA